MRSELIDIALLQINDEFGDNACPADIADVTGDVVANIILNMIRAEMERREQGFSVCAHVLKQLHAQIYKEVME